MLIIVFGEMGMGKNFVGDLLAKEFSFHFYDGDRALSRDQKLLNKMDVDNFVKSQLIPSIESEVKKHPNLVVSQALYREEHRKMILNHFNKMDVKFIHVTASGELQKERLLKRLEAETFWLPYADRSRRRFEAPSLGNPLYAEITNNKDEVDVIKQIKALAYYPKSSSEFKSDPIPIEYSSSIRLFPLKNETSDSNKSSSLIKSIKRIFCC